MSGSALAQFDWPGWRADVVERLDRRSIYAASAFAAAWSAPPFVVAIVRGNWTHLDVGVAKVTLFSFSTVMVTLAVLAIALVAVARGVSVWMAYPAAALAALAFGAVIGGVIEPFRWDLNRPRQLAPIVVHLYVLTMLVPPAVLYVYASKTSHDEKVLRAVEADRAAEAERLARQRLQTELATVDHDLVLRAMRLALAAPEREAAQAEALLEAVTAYLRVAQQRDSSEPGRIAAALAELRQACASRDGAPVQHVIA